MKEDSRKYKPEDIIRLNVGGQRFDTFLGTLLADRSNEIYPQFVVLLDPETTVDPPPPTDSEGAFFLDRDPDSFRVLLNGLRYLIQSQCMLNFHNRVLFFYYASYRTPVNPKTPVIILELPIPATPIYTQQLLLIHHISAQQLQNGTIKNTCSEEDLRPGKENRGIWHRFRGK
ncbi:unnamed protein product [Strongylus vulgaris]|uniref:Potassium channel tetramerisation-type BTB domain-containing protein n=1 Tax=Strongylus vulgaris TaxID=40348 RepID=A0A3P7IXF8_STRVU|nr:unnamed protein product [Strongylus vulgaris]